MLAIVINTEFDKTITSFFIYFFSIHDSFLRFVFFVTVIIGITSPIFFSPTKCIDTSN